VGEASSRGLLLVGQRHRRQSSPEEGDPRWGGNDGLSSDVPTALVHSSLRRRGSSESVAPGSQRGASHSERWMESRGRVELTKGDAPIGRLGHTVREAAEGGRASLRAGEFGRGWGGISARRLKRWAWRCEMEVGRGSGYDDIAWRRGWGVRLWRRRVEEGKGGTRPTGGPLLPGAGRGMQAAVDGAMPHGQRERDWTGEQGRSGG
jgi:hypothetical protein